VRILFLADRRLEGHRLLREQRPERQGGCKWLRRELLGLAPEKGSG
jgi:hypothetical protein